MHVVKFIILLMLFIGTGKGKVISSSTGTEFVFAFLGERDDRRQIVLINTLQESPAINVKLTIPSLSISETFTVTKSAHHISQWPDRNNTCYEPIIIRADGEVFVHAQTISDIDIADSFNALPTSSLGTKYHLLQYKPVCSTAEIVVVALGDGDTNIVLSNLGIGMEFEITETLAPYEAFIKKGSGVFDWTGVVLTSNKPVAVISGVKCGIVPNDGNLLGANGCGMLVEMVPDVDSYGRHFVLTTFWPRLSGFLYRVLASQDATKFTVTSSDHAVVSKYLHAGDFHEGNVDKQYEILTIKATKPVIVVQYAKSRNPPYGLADGVSDPFMTLVPAVEHYSDDLVFTSNDAVGNATKVSITSLCHDHSAIIMDGVAIEDWTKLRAKLMDFTYQGMCVTHLELGRGVQQHSIEHPDGAKFLAIAYGTGPTTSFAYPLKYNVHVEEDPLDWQGKLTKLGENALISSGSIVGFFIIVLSCCVCCIRRRRRIQRSRPWYDIPHTTVRSRPIIAISSIKTLGQDVGELSSSSHSQVAVSIDNVNGNATVHHEGRELKDDTISCHGEFDVVGVSNNGRKIRGILRITSDNETRIRKSRSKSLFHIERPPLSTRQTNNDEPGFGSNSAHLEVVSIGSQNYQSDEFVSSSSSSCSSFSSVGSKNLFILAEGVVSIEEPSPGSAVHFETEKKSVSSSTISEGSPMGSKDILAEEVASIASIIEASPVASASTLHSEGDESQIAPAPHTNKEDSESIASEFSMQSKVDESSMTSPSALQPIASASTLHSMGDESSASTTHLEKDDSSIASTLLEEVKDIDSSSTLTERLSIPEDSSSRRETQPENYKLRYYNHWKDL